MYEVGKRLPTINDIFNYAIITKSKESPLIFSKNIGGNNNIVLGEVSDGGGESNVIVGRAGKVSGEANLTISTFASGFINGSDNHAFGKYGMISGNGNTVLSSYPNSVSGNYNISISSTNGYGSINGDNIISIGTQYVSASNTTAIGGGYISGKNAIVIGTPTKYATASGGISIGPYASSTSQNSIAIGNSSSAYANNDSELTETVSQIAIGTSSHIYGSKNSIAIGYNAVVGSNQENQENNIALGACTRVESKNSVAIGYGSVANEENIVSFGTDNINVDDSSKTTVKPLYRRIINIADAQNDHDAVTKAQMTTSISTATKYANVKKYNVQKFAISGTDAVTEFTITNKPENTTYTQLYDSEDGMVELEINHTIYHQDEDFTFDKDTEKIIWTATKENNGFDITTDLCNSVRVKYAYIYNA